NFIVNKVNTAILYPIIFTICLAAAYSIRQSIFDIFLVFMFGVVGILVMRTGFSRVAIIIGLILGGLMELSFGQTLVMGEGSLAVVFERPIAVALLVVIVIMLIVPIISKLRRKPGVIEDVESEAKKASGGTDS